MAQGTAVPSVTLVPELFLIIFCDRWSLKLTPPRRFSLPLGGVSQERAIEATRERLRSELGELALKRSTLINGNFREMPAELEPLSVQLVV